MTTRVARATILSVGVVVFLTAVYFWLVNESHFKPSKAKPEGYSGQLSFHTGSSSGALLSEQAVRQARAIREGRLKKMSWDYGLKVIPDNRFELSVDQIQGQESVVELLHGSGDLERGTSLEYYQAIAILLTSVDLIQPVQILHTCFIALHSGPSPPVKSIC